MKNKGKSSIIALNNPDHGLSSYIAPAKDLFVPNKKGDYLEDIRRKITPTWLLIPLVTLGMTVVGAIWTVKQPAIYQGRFQLLLDNPLTPVNKEREDTKIDYATQVQVLQSSSVLKPILKQVEAQYSDLDYSTLITGKESPLTIEQLSGTKIIEVTFTNTNPRKIEGLLDHLAQSYLNYNQKQNTVKKPAEMTFVNQQLAQLQQQISQRQQQLEKLRQEHNFLNPQQKSQELSQLLQQLQALDFETQVKRKETEAIYDLLQQKLELSPQEALAASILSESPRYQAILNELQNVEVELAKESARFLEDSPVIQGIKDKKDNLLLLLEQEAQKNLGNQANTDISLPSSGVSPSSLRLSLQQQLVETESQMAVLRVRQTAINEEIQAVKAKIAEMPLLERQYTNIQRELTIATENFNRLMATSQQMQLEAASQKTVSWQLISPPEVKQMPIYSQLIQNMSVGAIFGLLLGIVMANIPIKNEQ